MAVTLVGVTTGSAEFATVTLSSHASTQVGDLLVAICFRDEGYVTSSWTGNPFTKLGGLDAGTSATTGGRVEVWTGTAAAAGATSYSYVDSNSNSTGTVHLFVLRGAGTPTMATQNNTTSSTSSAAPSVGAGTLDFLICGWDARSGGAARTWTVPAGMTTAGQINPTGTYIVTFAASQAAVAAGAKTATLNTASTSLAVAVQVPALAVSTTSPFPPNRRARPNYRR